MEPLEQNFVCLSFFNYNVGKLTKKTQKRMRSIQINGMFEKSGYFQSREGTNQTLFNFFMSYTVTELID